MVVAVVNVTESNDKGKVCFDACIDVQSPGEEILANRDKAMRSLCRFDIVLSECSL